MRSIKFRIRNKNNGQWWYFDLWDEDMGKINQDNLDKTTIGQFTGLLDKQGKEIYEGDILLNISEFSKDQKRVSEVKWLDGSFIEHTQKICDKESNYIEPFHFRKAIAEDREVIGNIYEPPELLN